MITPGLRGFVMDPEASAGDDAARDLLPAALTALEPGFTLVAEHGAPGSGARRRTWLDTFDWRLYRAGLVLELEHGRRGGRLLLTKADGTPQAEQPVPAGRGGVAVWPRTCPPARCGTGSWC